VLCDFGLARVMADVASRTIDVEARPVAGGRHWMAPERLMGAVLRKPCDIYAFGMTSYELYTSEVPLGYISDVDLRELVVEKHIRPERPDDDEAPQLTDEVWDLMEHCWSGDPRGRPTGSAIIETIRSMLAVRNSSQPASS